MTEDDLTTAPDAPDPQQTWGPWKGRIDAARKRRDERIAEWRENVESRKGGRLQGVGETTTTLTTTHARVSVNQDWPLTKAKIAQLYSQTPEVRLSPRFQEFQEAIPAFGRELNGAIADASVGTTIEEVLADVVNASGIGGCLVSCDLRTEQRAVPVVDPALLPPDAEVPTAPVTVTTDVKYQAQRISPGDLLVPSDFTGSNYDHARWLGEEGTLTWPQGKAMLGLTDAQKDDVVGAGKKSRGAPATNSLNTDATVVSDTDVVTYQQIFYWRHFYHAEETNFKALQRVVFVDGIDGPVINEPYQAQRRTPDGRLAGVTKNPIRILTLTYISDEGLPPSDSSISRAQVAELDQSRDSMLQQRRHSTPIRWFDTNRIGANTRSLLEKGTYQGFIPTNGPGERAIGEVARASFPQENFEFDAVIKRDITEQWQVGTNQAGAFASGERSASEAKIVQQNFQTRVGQERDKVTRFFLGIAEVLAGHLALYGTFALPDELGPRRELLATGFSYSVRADSTVRMDAQQRIEQLKEFFNLTFQTGFINPKPIVQEWAELSGLDPDKVIVDPQPKPPEPVKVSVSNAEDLMNPLFLSLLMRTQQGPTPEDLKAAMTLYQSVTLMAAPPVTAPTAAPPGGEVQTPDTFNADMGTAPRLERRAEDGGA